MSNPEEIDRVVAELRLLTFFEKRVVRNRLKMYFGGRMTLWVRQVNRTGVESFGYVVLGAAWGTIAVPFALCGSLLILYHHKPQVIGWIQAGCLAVAFIELTFSIFRIFQGVREGRHYQQS
jgi:hypothetical protein